jgi:hypothetical protein
MTNDQIESLVSDWVRTFDVKLTATQHMGLQLALRDARAANGAIGEREAFEAWVRSKDAAAPMYRRDVKGSERIGQYCMHWIQDQWESWQARAALTPPKPSCLHVRLNVNVCEDCGAEFDFV